MSNNVQLVKDDLLAAGMTLTDFNVGPVYTNEKIHYGGEGEYIPFEIAIGDGAMENLTYRSLRRYNDLDDFLPRLVKLLEDLPATFPPTDILKTDEYKKVKCEIIMHQAYWGRPFCPF